MKVKETENRAHGAWRLYICERVNRVQNFAGAL